ncbi:hypothetical protein [Moraxella lincolnii]|uniref:hypothetical protein n=1 Tax=Lwoffella lincolnii TaxID=90241 RepID=UPI0039844A4C
MKLTLNLEELQQAVTEHLNQQGITLDTTNATYTFSTDGCDINFGLETTKKPTKKRKPKEQEAEVVKETTEDTTDDTDKLTESDEPFDDDNYSVFG